MPDVPSFTQLPDKAGRAHAFVLDVRKANSEVTTVVFLDHVPSPPLVPAALWDTSEHPGYEVFQLHYLKDVTGNQLTCLTFEFSGDLPKAQLEYAFQQWWLPDSMELVTDRTRKWQLKDYPDNGKHDFCPLTWENISAYEGARQGYESNDRWITVEAYNKYIRDDFLRVRGRSA